MIQYWFPLVVSDIIKFLVAPSRNVSRSKLVSFHARRLWVKTVLFFQFEVSSADTFPGAGEKAWVYFSSCRWSMTMSRGREVVYWLWKSWQWGYDLCKLHILCVALHSKEQHLFFALHILPQDFKSLSVTLRKRLVVIYARENVSQNRKTLLTTILVCLTSIVLLSMCK